MRLLAAFVVSMMATSALAQGQPTVSIPEARLDLTEADIARVAVAGDECHILLKKTAAERLRTITAATVGGRLTVTLDGMFLLRSWVSGEIDSGVIDLQKVDGMLLARLQEIERRVGPSGATRE